MTHSESVGTAHSEIIRLAGGRELAFSIVGDLAATPLFFFHGIPGSRLSARIVASVVAEAGVCVVSPDRPGFGLSGPKPGRTILDWPHDVAQLADALGLNRFGLVAVSGGTPYLAACSLLLPERVTFAAIISGVGPLETAEQRNELAGLNRRLLRISDRHPRFTVALLGFFSWLARNSPSALFSILRRSFSHPDRKILDRPLVRHLIEDDLRESFRQGAEAIKGEADLLLKPWGFNLADIEIRIDLWHGEEDLNVPVMIARRMAKLIPGCRPRFLTGEGHLLIVNHLDDIVADLLARASS